MKRPERPVADTEVGHLEQGSQPWCPTSFPLLYRRTEWIVSGGKENFKSGKKKGRRV